MRPTAMEIHEYQHDAPPMIGIGVPTFGMVSIRWHMCMLGLGMPMNVPSTLFSVIGAEIGDARNEIVQRALAFEHPKTKARISHLQSQVPFDTDGDERTDGADDHGFTVIQLDRA